MRRRFICTHCDATRETEVVNINGDPHDGCPNGPAYWVEIPQSRERCPHGLDWGDCNDCMIAGDLAFDAARERGR